jgi:HEAT repeat protein
MEALADEDHHVPAKAAIALGQIGPAARRAIPALTPLLNHDDDFIRVQAARALGTIGVGNLKMLVDALHAALDNGETRMAESLVIALHETGAATDDVYTVLLSAAVRGSQRLRDEARSAIRKIDPSAEIRENKKSITFKAPGRIVVAAFFRRITERRSD